MAIPDKIKQLANDIRSKVYGREVRESLAKGIEEAGNLADKANTKSENAVYQVNNIQAQVNQLVVEGDSSVEAAQARVDAEGNTYTTLKERLDTEHGNIITRLKDKAQKPHTLEIIAHRGFNDLYPENTMTAFSMALYLGADALECDVQISSDGVPVIIHDDTVDRTTNGSGNVKDMTLAQLKSLDAGSKIFGSNFSSCKIPTFDEFLMFARGKVKKIYPEIKGIRNVDDIQLIVDPIVAYDMETSTVIQSFTIDHLNEVRRYSDKVNFGYLMETVPTEDDYQILENDGNCTLLINYTVVILNPSVISECKSRGIDIGVWTVSSMDVISSLLSMGVYKIMTSRLIGGDII